MSKTAQYKETGLTTCRNCGIHSDWYFDTAKALRCRPCRILRFKNRSLEQRTKQNKRNLYWQQNVSPINYKISAIKARCKKIKREFNLTKHLIEELFIKQTNKCALSGMSISPQDFSVDRIDSSKGYTPDNIQLVKLIFNQMKRDLTDTQFIEYCKIVASHHGSK